MIRSNYSERLANIKSMSRLVRRLVVGRRPGGGLIRQQHALDVRAFVATFHHLLHEFRSDVNTRCGKHAAGGQRLDAVFGIVKDEHTAIRTNALEAPAPGRHVNADGSGREGNVEDRPGDFAKIV